MSKREGTGFDVVEIPFPEGSLGSGERHMRIYIGDLQFTKPESSFKEKLQSVFNELRQKIAWRIWPYYD